MILYQEIVILKKLGNDIYKAFGEIYPTQQKGNQRGIFLCDLCVNYIFPR